MNNSFKVFFDSFLAEYGVFYLFLVVGAVLIASLMEKIKAAGFGKDGGQVDKPVPVYYWLLGAVFALGWTAAMSYEFPHPGDLIALTVHAVLLYCLQYFLSMKIIKKIVSAVRNYAIWKIERKTQQDIDGDGALDRPKSMPVVVELSNDMDDAGGLRDATDDKDVQP